MEVDLFKRACAFPTLLMSSEMSIPFHLSLWSNQEEGFIEGRFTDRNDSSTLTSLTPQQIKFQIEIEIEFYQLEGLIIH